MNNYKQYKGEIKKGGIYRGGNGKQYRKVLKVGLGDIHYSQCDFLGIAYPARCRKTDYACFVSWTIEEVNLK